MYFQILKTVLTLLPLSYGYINLNYIKKNVNSESIINTGLDINGNPDEQCQCIEYQRCPEEDVLQPLEPG